jgi:hypothetical protein
MVADAAVETAPVIPPAAPSSGAMPCYGNATRCTVRITAKGIYVDGDRTTRDAAVAACKRTACALVALDEGASPDEWKALQTALRRAGISISMRGTVEDGVCLNNPLAKGCN